MMQLFLLLSAFLLGFSTALESTSCQGPGVTYTGTLSETKSGRTCQNWNETSPQRHTYTDAGDHNYCRNPTRKDDVGVWCYTTTPWIRWEKCNVPICEESTTTTTTTSTTTAPENIIPTTAGTTEPQSDGIIPFTASEICEVRNPDRSNEALCNSLSCCYFDYFADNGPTCRADSPNSICKDQLGCQSGSPLGADYKGEAHITVSGRTCQGWFLQTPHRHNFASMGGHNLCRNPDGEPGAWCYTTDPHKRWELCPVSKCADLATVNCSVSEWTDWDDCSKACEGGDQGRTRSVQNPGTGGGKVCPHLSESRECNKTPCPKGDCTVGLWSQWTTCSKTCDGRQDRSRRIANPKIGEGKDCPVLRQWAKCSSNSCPGVWQEWGEWSECDPSSSSWGKKIRARACSVGCTASSSSAACQGNPTETAPCSPVDCEVGEWTAWGSCSATCGGGSKTKTREILQEPRNGGDVCPVLEETAVCNTASCVCQSTEWTRWSECSKSCGGGESLRTRKVDITGCDTSCQYETLTESKGCNVDPCPCESLPPSSEWGAWSECSTNQTCEGQGVQTRLRSVVNSVGHSCFQENVMMVQSCNSDLCPCPYSPTQWTEWSTCSATCGGGKQVKEREVVLGSGSSCFKQRDLQTKACNADECPVRDVCTWWEFLGGNVFEKKDSETFPEDTWSCHANLSALGEKASKYMVGMGSEYVGMLSPIKSLCGACILFTSLEKKVSIGIVTHMVPSGWHVSENIFQELDLEKNPGAPVLRAEVVECPLDLVKEDIGIQVLKTTRGGIHGISYQAINMRNPISRMSISQDEGETWTGLSQDERSAAFLHPLLLNPSLDISIRVEPWMGGSNVEVNIGPITFQDGAVISTAKNNVCRTNCKHTGTGWTVWSLCTPTCGEGTRMRTRSVVAGSGINCTMEEVTSVEDCNTVCSTGTTPAATITTTAATTTPTTGASGQVVVGGIRTDQMSSAELFPRPLPGHPCSIPDLPDRRSDHTLSLISGERLVVCGGFDESLSILDSCLSWVDGNASWTPLYTMSVPRSTHTAWTPPSLPDTIVLLGGTGSAAELTAETIPGGFKFPLKHNGRYGCGIPDGETFILTGGGSWVRHNYVTRYNVRGFVEELPQLPEDRFRHACAALPDTGALVVAGGHSGPLTYGSNDLSSVLTLLPGATAWTPLASLPRGLSGLEGSILGGRLRVNGGQSAGSYRSEVLEYQPSDQWVVVGTLQVERSRHAILSIGTQQLPCILADCEVGTWSAWTGCSATCGGGTNRRSREVLQEPGNGGAACPTLLEETLVCNTDVCPVDCKVDEWTAWDRCSVTCGGADTRRTRTVLQEPKFGGTACPALEETTICNPVKCAVPCKFGEWTAWGACNVECGAGTKTRTRPAVQKPKYGGAACPPLEETMVCTTPSCVVVSLQVTSATTLEVLPEVSVKFTLGALEVQSSTTDDQGVATFKISPSTAALGLSATIEMSKEGFIGDSAERKIVAGEANPTFGIFLSPKLTEGEHRLVLSWDTVQDIDLHILQQDKSTGATVCKISWVAKNTCDRVSLEAYEDKTGPGPETITWRDAASDPYKYFLYVNAFNGDFARSGVKISIYDDKTTPIKMEVPEGATVGDRFWNLGSFEPSLGLSSFAKVDALQSSDPVG